MSIVSISLRLRRASTHRDFVRRSVINSDDEAFLKRTLRLIIRVIRVDMSLSLIYLSSFVAMAFVISKETKFSFSRRSRKHLVWAGVSRQMTFHLSLIRSVGWTPFDAVSAAIQSYLVHTKPRFHIKPFFICLRHRFLIKILFTIINKHNRESFFHSMHIPSLNIMQSWRSALKDEKRSWNFSEVWIT